MQVVMAKLIMMFFKQRNFKALKMLSRQLQMPGEQMLRVAKHTVSKAKPTVKPQTIAEKIEAIRTNPEAARNFAGNLGRQMDRNVARHGGRSKVKAPTEKEVLDYYGHGPSKATFDKYGTLERRFDRLPKKTDKPCVDIT